ncbi:MAG: hypothetical protein MN733_16555 [Nitrososphaera sp.]|nr:hypothetical protein [Nitrososphaera sp.]
MRTKSWSDAARLMYDVLGSRYLRGIEIGDTVSVKYVYEEWNGHYQHHYKMTIIHLDTKCAICGLLPAECICDNPVL